MHVKVRDLPQTLQSTLSSVGYHGADVRLEPSDTYVMSAGGSSDGRKAFVVAVDLATGKKDRRDGSWGGPNMFNPQNEVDLDREARPLPPNFAVIYGSYGQTVSVYRVLLNPASLTPLLPAPVEMSKVDAVILSMYAGLTSAGRKNQIERWIEDAGYAADPKYLDRAGRMAASVACKRLIESATDRLVERKFLARNKAGAISVTTEGKNVRSAMGRFESSPGGLGWFPGKAEAKEVSDAR